MGTHWCTCTWELPLVHFYCTSPNKLASLEAELAPEWTITCMFCVLYSLPLWVLTISIWPSCSFTPMIAQLHWFANLRSCCQLTTDQRHSRVICYVLCRTTHFHKMHSPQRHCRFSVCVFTISIWLSCGFIEHCMYCKALEKKSKEKKRQGKWDNKVIALASSLQQDDDVAEITCMISYCLW